MSSFIVFLHEWSWAACTLIILSSVGYLPLVPFGLGRPNIILAAPFCGLIVLVLLTIGGYSFGNLPFRVSAVGSWAAVSIPAIFLALKYNWIPVVWWHGVFLLGLTAVTTLMCCAATLQSGVPAIGFFDGTDHAGYAQMGDWLLHHRVTEVPNGTPESPYESFPALLFARDPRFGSFAVIALVAATRGLSGLFSYDPAVSIVFSTAVAAVVGLVAMRARGALFVAAGLLLSGWYEYSQTGYFGKLVAYPGILVASLLYLHSLVTKQRFAIQADLLVCGIFTAGVAMSYPGLIVFCLLSVICLTGVIFSVRCTGIEWKSALVTFVIMGLIALCSTGALSRPFSVVFPDYGVGWDYVIGRTLDLENQGIWVSGLSSGLRISMGVLAVVMWAALVTFSLKSRDIESFALLAAPALMLILFLCLDRRAAAFQLMGFVFPVSFCGGAYLLRGHTASWRTMSVAACLLLMVAPRIPRAMADMGRYTGGANLAYQFSQRSVDNVISQISDGGDVKIDVSDPRPALVLLDELGGRIPLQYTEATWKMLFDARSGPMPNYKGIPAHIVTWAAPTGYVVRASAP